MFRQNAHTATGLSQNQIEGQYFRLYYQFIKHGFGLFYHPPAGNPVALKIYFDELPETREATTQFKGYILGLKDNVEIRQAGLTLSIEDIAEIRSHDHVLAQCLDVVLGAMSFRLNDKHKAIPQGQHRRGKRTIAKEKLYKTILAEINQTKRNFNIGISTGGTLKDRWFAKYRHWRFVPSEIEYHKELTKPKAKK